MNTCIRKAFFLPLLAVGLVFAGCNARKDYPEPAIGWHSPSYNVVYGQLYRLPGPSPEAPAVWIIRFGAPSQQNQGLFALTPPERFVGYSGGEHVEIRGRIFNETTTDAYNGRWYVVDSIQLWAGYH